MAPYGSDQGMAEWSNNGDPDDYPPRWLSRALCRQGLNQFRHAEYAVSLGLPPTTLIDTRLLPGAKLDGLHVCSEAFQWRAKIWL